MEYFYIGLAHSDFAEPSDIINGIVNAFFNNPVSAAELLAMLYHIISQQAGIQRQDDLAGTGSFCAVTDHSRRHGQRIDQRMGDDPVIPAFQESDAAGGGCAGIDSAAVG